MFRRTPFLPLISSMAAILILAAGCSDQVPTGVQLQKSYRAIALPEAALTPSFARSGAASRVIGPEGGTIQAGRITLSFPAGAVAAPTKIIVSPDPRNLAVTLEPHGLQFPAGREPSVTFSYRGISSLPESDLTILYLAETGVALEQLAVSVSTGSRSVTSRLRHFSEYALVAP